MDAEHITTGINTTNGYKNTRDSLFARLHAFMKQRPFLHKVAIMLSGAAGGQVISLLLAPVLTRLYLPEEFGILSVYLAILGIVAEVSLLRYEIAIPLARSESDAFNLIAVCLCALLTTTALVTFGSFHFLEYLLAALRPTSGRLLPLHIYRVLIPVGFFSLGAYFIALYAATRDEAFRQISRSRLNQGIFGPSTQIGWRLLGHGTWGLLLGSIIGQSAGTIGLWANIFSKPALLRTITWKRMRELAWRYRRFPFVSSWSALIEIAAGNQLLYLQIAVLYSPRIAGYLLLVERVVARPLVILGTSILQVYIGEAGKLSATDPRKLQQRFRQVVFHQSCLAFIWIVVANIGGAILFPVVFGSSWGEAVSYLQAISLGYFALALVQPVLHTLQILERQAMAAVWQVTRLVLLTAVFFAGAHFRLSAARTVMGYSMVQAVCCVALIGLMIGALRQLSPDDQSESPAIPDALRGN